MTVLASQHLYRLTSQWKHPLKWKEKVRTARLEMLIDNIDCRAFVVQAFPTLLSFCSPPRPYVSRVTVLASQHLYRLTSQWKHPLKWKEKVRTARLEMLFSLIICFVLFAQTCHSSSAHQMGSSSSSKVSQHYDPCLQAPRAHQHPRVAV